MEGARLEAAVALGGEPDEADGEVGGGGCAGN